MSVCVRVRMCVCVCDASMVKILKVGVCERVCDDVCERSC